MSVKLSKLVVVPMLFPSLSACGQTGPWRSTPSVQLANEIEGKIRRLSCVGSMGQWERHYTFSSKPSSLATLLTIGMSDRWYNYQSIKIDLREAPFAEFHPRRILGEDVPPAADDRDYNVVFGHYDIPSHTAYIWACGPNMPADIDRNIVVH